MFEKNTVEVTSNKIDWVKEKEKLCPSCGIKGAVDYSGWWHETDDIKMPYVSFICSDKWDCATSWRIVNNRKKVKT